MPPHQISFDQQHYWDAIQPSDCAQGFQTTLLLEAHHAQPGFRRFADALRALQREDAHLGSGKSFTDFAVAEFGLSPLLIDVIMNFRDEGTATEK